MKKYTLFAGVICSVLLFGSCRKESCSAGTGGNYALKIYPQHHGEAIPGSVAYVEFNTQSSPGALSEFDMKAEAEPGSDYISLNNMRCGDYYIYCVGIDDDGITTEIVRGGIPFSVPDGAGGLVKIYVPVTE